MWCECHIVPYQFVLRYLFTWYQIVQCVISCVNWMFVYRQILHILTVRFLYILMNMLLFIRYILCFKTSKQCVLLVLFQDPLVCYLLCCIVYLFTCSILNLRHMSGILGDLAGSDRCRGCVKVAPEPHAAWFIAGALCPTLPP